MREDHHVVSYTDDKTRELSWTDDILVFRLACVREDQRTRLQLQCLEFGIFVDTICGGVDIDRD